MNKLNSTIAYEPVDFINNVHDDFYINKLIIPKLENLPLYYCDFQTCRFKSDFFRMYEIHFPDSIQSSVTKRQAGYFSGRLSAKFALNKLGVESFNVLTGIHRNPLWPTNVLGSITHTDDRAYAAVGYQQDFQFIGIDYEKLLSSKAILDIESLIISPKESAFLKNTELNYEKAFSLTFSAKESLFKALYPIYKDYFDFSVAEITSISNGEFKCKLTKSLSNELYKGKAFNGFYKFNNFHVLTIIAS